MGKHVKKKGGKKQRRRIVRVFKMSILTKYIGIRQSITSIIQLLQIFFAYHEYKNDWVAVFNGGTQIPKWQRERLQWLKTNFRNMSDLNNWQFGLASHFDTTFIYIKGKSGQKFIDNNMLVLPLFDCCQVNWAMHIQYFFFAKDKNKWKPHQMKYKQLKGEKCHWNVNRSHFIPLRVSEREITLPISPSVSCSHTVNPLRTAWAHQILM